MADRKTKHYDRVALDYAQQVIAGQIVAGKEIVLACERYIADLQNPEFELHTKDPDFVCGIIEKFIVNRQGQSPDGKPLLGEPLILQPWQIFCVYNLLGFYFAGTIERRYKEAFIFVPRKQGKTTFIAGLSFGLGILERRSGSKIYIAAASQQQACESFDTILFALDHHGLKEQFNPKDNNAEHSISYIFEDGSGKTCGSLYIRALASNPKKHDSLNSNICIADEVHAMAGAEYNRLKESMKSYVNKLMIGISTAGDNINSFCFRRLEYACKVVNGIVKDDSLFVFVARADQDEKGNVDYTDPIQHQKANPSLGVTIRAQDLMQEALQAQNDPQQRKDFLSRSLNIYTNSMKAYFDIDEIKASDRQYDWTLDELVRLPINWYGGADLSRLYDLTAAALYGNYNGVDIVISHAFFPITQAVAKADEDNIPLFGWKDNGWLTLCNAPTVNMADIVNWFKAMRDKGFKIRQVGHDRKFAGEEYFPAMQAARFNIKDQPQYFYVKSQGFRHIENKIKNGEFYYLHSEAYEYCISNVYGIEKTDDAIQYEKTEPHNRIDLFDASVFACVCMINDKKQSEKLARWFG